MRLLLLLLSLLFQIFIRQDQPISPFFPIQSCRPSLIAEDNINESIYEIVYANVEIIILMKRILLAVKKKQDL